MVLEAFPVRKLRLPDGPWDLVIAALAIHYLFDDEKRELFQ